MKHTIKIVFFLILFAVFYWGCKDEPVIPASPQIGFNAQILPIIIGNCTASGCHGKENKEAFELLSYNDVIKRGKVKASNAKGSELYQVITSNSVNVKMPPPPASDLTEQQIELIYLWIMQGANNN